MEESAVACEVAVLERHGEAHDHVTADLAIQADRCRPGRPGDIEAIASVRCAKEAHIGPQVPVWLQADTEVSAWRYGNVEVDGLTMTRWTQRLGRLAVRQIVRTDAGSCAISRVDAFELTIVARKEGTLAWRRIGGRRCATDRRRHRSRDGGRYRHAAAGHGRQGSGGWRHTAAGDRRQGADGRRDATGHGRRDGHDAAAGRQRPNRWRDTARQGGRDAGDRRQGADGRRDATGHDRRDGHDAAAGRQCPNRWRDTARQGGRDAGDRRQGADGRSGAPGRDGRVPMGGFTPPGNIGVSVEKPGNSLPIGGTTRPGGLRLGKVICGGSVIPAFWFWVSSRHPCRRLCRRACASRRCRSTRRARATNSARDWPCSTGQPWCCLGQRRV